MGSDVKVREGVSKAFGTFSGNKWNVALMFEVARDKIKDIDLPNPAGYNIRIDRINSAMFPKKYAEKEILNTLNELYETHQGDTEGYK